MTELTQQQELEALEEWEDEMNDTERACFEELKDSDELGLYIKPYHRETSLDIEIER